MFSRDVLLPHFSMCYKSSQLLPISSPMKHGSQVPSFPISLQPHHLASASPLHPQHDSCQSRCHLMSPRHQHWTLVWNLRSCVIYLPIQSPQICLTSEIWLHLTPPGISFMPPLQTYHSCLDSGSHDALLRFLPLKLPDGVLPSNPFTTLPSE